jgi:hypothetical protein
MEQLEAAIMLFVLLDMLAYVNMNVYIMSFTRPSIINWLL